ncbi:uncharacterized protein LOC126735388 [Anthonomus grandis grandis]|uniref:uncharacterized protein LOC126735388 n=1 Tax=Anthonomus grandis grandis TaxID=2921223 RepID=UPI0021651A85|nr:uncharacterized protein LOC126735388 [Anthonomus grandis grandis]
MTPIKNIEKALEEFTIIDKTSLEEDICCTVCNRYLNVPPIIFNSNIGNICGRCNSVVTTNLEGSVLRQHAFEDLIKNLTFPCTNKNYGCDQILKMVEVPDHEKSCRFQCTNCPLFYKQLFPNEFCSWNGNSNLLNDHLKTHQEFFLDPPKFEWPKEGKNLIFFTTVGNQICTVVIKHDINTKYVCCVMVSGNDLEAQCFRYQLELSDEDNTNSLIIRKSRLELVANLAENLSWPEKVLEIDTDKIADMLQNPKKIQAKVSIVKKHKKELIQIMGLKEDDTASGIQNSVIPAAPKEKNANPDSEMLAELECPVCNEFMIPPIYICSTGHSVCSDCKAMVPICPSCRNTFANGRNFTLEKLTQKVKYPCKNREIGCGFVTTSDKIKKHQNSCELSENPCILKCGWKGLAPGLYNHFRESHRDQIIENNKFIQKDMKNDRTPLHNFLYVMGEMFCFTYRNCGKSAAKFIVQHVGNLKDEPQYKYNITFSPSADAQFPNLSMTLGCETWDPNLPDALNGVRAVNVPGDLLKNYMFQNRVYHVKVHITKI